MIWKRQVNHDLKLTVLEQTIKQEQDKIDGLKIEKQKLGMQVIVAKRRIREQTVKINKYQIDNFMLKHQHKIKSSALRQEIETLKSSIVVSCLTLLLS